MDTYADDLAVLVNSLDLKNAIHVGHSTGGGEVVKQLTAGKGVDVILDMGLAPMCRGSSSAWPTTGVCRSLRCSAAAAPRWILTRF
jgi:hypothetical protein